MVPLKAHTASSGPYLGAGRPSHRYKQQLGAFKEYKPARTSDPEFTIDHYAGSVTYSSVGFLEKNRDTLAYDLIGVMQTSSNSVVSTVFLEDMNEDPAPAKSGGGAPGRRGGMPAGGMGTVNTARKRAATVGAQFSRSLKILLDKMMACMAHFVRCIKPNTQQAPKQFVPEFVNAQLRYTGMLETTRIRREGYSYRPSFEQFMERFGLLAYGANSGVQASKQTCSRVLAASGVGGWQLGLTKVFLKYWQVEQLDKSIRLYHDNAATLQKVGRGFLARQFRRRARVAAREETRQAALLFDQMARDCGRVHMRLSAGTAEDMRRFASGQRPKPVARPAAPPKPQKTEAELKREASILWWKEKEAPKGAGQDSEGEMLPWFHGLISRREAERLLEPRYVGCFLVRRFSACCSRASPPFPSCLDCCIFTHFFPPTPSPLPPDCITAGPCERKSLRLHAVVPRVGSLPPLHGRAGHARSLRPGRRGKGCPLSQCSHRLLPAQPHQRVSEQAPSLAISPPTPRHQHTCWRTDDCWHVPDAPRPIMRPSQLIPKPTNPPPTALSASLLQVR